ncbi:DUF2683 family protein [Epilithonimonas lactis]|uniref:Uncharacterized protein n=1 Tax=Epilithonimonas lactis TaxID=421072 RepID=A0A085BHR7_9FLAO|nr:hypothetical protein IO89_08580 [Epilithonimonas lactis]SEQ51687.1 hypothetical protein SAMN04488097_2329 [Epilithonimonas lactis]
MSPENIFIAHPKNAEQVEALKSVMKSFKIKFEMKKSDETLLHLDEITKSLSQVRKIKEGKLKKQSAREFLDEI